MMTDKEIAAWEGVEKQRDVASTFMLFIALLFGLAVFAGVLAASNDYDCADGTVIVQPGDTLWGIVEEHCEGDVRSAVTAFDVSTFTLTPGQELQLP
jgi:nucleoid-associated protein YgaU